MEKEHVGPDLPIEPQTEVPRYDDLTLEQKREVGKVIVARPEIPMGEAIKVVLQKEEKPKEPIDDKSNNINYENLTPDQIERINQMISAPESKLNFEEAARIIIKGDKAQSRFREENKET